MRSRLSIARTTGVSLLALLLLLGAGCASKDAALRKDGVLRGKVVSMQDGDTITVLEGRTQHRIRLTGIDAPERHQAFGARSTENLASLVFQKEVEIHWTKRDHYNRILGKVMAPDPACVQAPCPLIDANLRQISGGFAWWYRQYKKDQPAEDRARYEEEERLSREAKRGLWAEPAPTPPWEFRRQGKMQKAAAKAAKASER